MSTNDDLAIFRQSVADLTEDELLALAAFLSLECTTTVSFPVFQNTDYFRETLKNTFEVSTNFDRSTKLDFAIELIRFCCDAEEDEDDENLEEPTWGYPGYYDENCPN